MDNVVSCTTCTWFPNLWGQLRRIFVPKQTDDNGHDSSICHNSFLANGHSDNSFNPVPENSLLLLPDDIITNIFSRLDAKSVFQCSYACRSLATLSLSLLSSPYFITAAPCDTIPSLIVQCYDSRNEYDKSDVVVHHIDLFRSNIPVTLRMKLKSSYPWPNIPYIPFLVGSYNGFLLFKNSSEYGPSIFSIWNPVTQEQVNVIAPRRLIACGFFFHSPTGEFRLLYMYTNLPYSRCFILSFKSGTKLVRKISNCAQVPCTHSAPVNLNGALYWIVSEDHTNPQGRRNFLCSKLILVFNIESEVFTTIPHPPIENCSDERHRRMRLLEMEGHLCLCDGTSPTVLDVWVLQEKQVWVRTHRINAKSIVPQRWHHEDQIYSIPCLEALYIQNGELLLECRGWKLFYYHLKQNTFRAIDTTEVGCLTSVIVHSNSKVSLNSNQFIILKTIQEETKRCLQMGASTTKLNADGAVNESGAGFGGVLRYWGSTSRLAAYSGSSLCKLVIQKWHGTCKN